MVFFEFYKNLKKKSCFFNEVRNENKNFIMHVLSVPPFKTKKNLKKNYKKKWILVEL